MKKDTVPLSIIIPTKNEEYYLPKLLRSIKEQDFKEEYEVVVADAGSTDSTKEIAKKYGCWLIKGGLHAEGVNNGIKASQGKVVLVLDADAILPSGFLTQNFAEFKKKNLDIASCYIKPVNGKFIDKITHGITNLYYFTFKRIRPYVPSFCFFTKRNFFLKVGGFDERVPWLVDLAFSNSLPQNMKYDILPVHVGLSVRMAERLGRFRQARIMFLGALLRILKKNCYVKYKWKGKN